MTEAVRNYSPLKYPGGKRWMVPLLARLYEHDGHGRRFVDLFCGAGSVTLGIRPERAVMNDVSTPVINFLGTWSRGEIEPGHDCFQNDADSYYQAREAFNRLNNHAQLRYKPHVAHLFYYLNKTCFNGLMRFSQRGNFNSPYGKYAQIDYASALGLPRCPGSWLLSNRHFSQVQLAPDDFIYADPPYDNGFVAYTPAGFTWSSQEELVHFLAPHHGPVLLSNAATPRIMKLYREAGYQLCRIPGPRKIAASGDRTPVTEVLAVRNLDISFLFEEIGKHNGTHD